MCARKNFELSEIEETLRDGKHDGDGEGNDTLMKYFFADENDNIGAIGGVVNMNQGMGVCVGMGMGMGRRGSREENIAYNNAFNTIAEDKEIERKDRISQNQNQNYNQIQDKKITPEKIEKMFKKAIKLRNSLKQCYWERQSTFTRNTNQDQV